MTLTEKNKSLIIDLFQFLKLNNELDFKCGMVDCDPRYKEIYSLSFTDEESLNTLLLAVLHNRTSFQQFLPKIAKTALNLEHNQANHVYSIPEFVYTL